MTRALIIVMDSFGIGTADDAESFGDVGADTLGHIAEACAGGTADVAGLRAGPLSLPNLTRRGLAAAAEAATGRVPAGLPSPTPDSLYGFAAEISRGKDTPSGHWEIAGLPVTFDWGYFPNTRPCFPAELTAAVIERGELPGVLGDRHASGTQIIEELGEEHMRTGKPIVYSSGDSVYQIACHEESFGLERLYQLCEIVRELVDPYNIGRVIARPFVGADAKSFERTGNRHDYATPPPADTLLDRVVAEGGTVHAVGKIGDIFAHRGVTRLTKASGHPALHEATLAALDGAGDRTLVFTNFVDFDMVYGHRRDTTGYAAALEAFDARLPEIEARLRPGDLAVITADHGCDPTWRGTDHTREFVPVLAFGPGIAPRAIGRRDTFADIGQTVAAHLGLAPLNHGTAFLT